MGEIKEEIIFLGRNPANLIVFYDTVSEKDKDVFCKEVMEVEVSGNVVPHVQKANLGGSENSVSDNEERYANKVNLLWDRFFLSFL